MKRISFYLPPSAIRLSGRFAFAGACALILATTSEPTLADPPSVQSDEMDAVSVDSDRSEQMRTVLCALSGLKARAAKLLMLRRWSRANMALPP